MQRVLHGTLPYFRYDYPGQGPDYQRWFRLHVAPIAEGADGLIIAHLDMTSIKQAELVLAQGVPVRRPPVSTAAVDRSAPAPEPAP
jgi:hypothetical protein